MHLTVNIRLQRFRDTMHRIPAQNVDTLKRLREAGMRLGLPGLSPTIKE